MVPDSILGTVEQAQSFWPLNYQWIASVIIQGLIAVGAILATIYAIKTFKLRRESSRSLMAPSDTPGNIEVEEYSSNLNIKISLMNFGTNPAVEGQGFIRLYNSDYKVIPLKNEPGWKMDTLWYNPIALEEKWNLTYKITMFPLLQIKFVRLNIEYKDLTLNREITPSPFFWEVNEEGCLIEPSLDDVDKLLAASIKVDNKEIGLPPQHT
ncbi:MAG: hypothetical protein KAU50_12620 [Candidatus Marinimicrobia bacterium]|nr:hypothetical protein [Candidatus Neomarinimicrobiota bacterium]